MLRVSGVRIEGGQKPEVMMPLRVIMCVLSLPVMESGMAVLSMPAWPFLQDS